MLAHAVSDKLLNNKEAEVSPWEKIKSLLINDPKPIFDHFRNIGITAALVLGGCVLNSFNLDANPWYLNEIVSVCSYVIFAVAAGLLIINTSYAQISINIFFFNKTKFESFFKKIGSAIVIYSYTGILIALTVMYSLNAADNRTKKHDQQQAAPDKLYLKIEKVNETIGKLENKIIKLRTENTQLKEESRSLNLEIAKFNKLIQPTANASAD